MAAVNIIEGELIQFRAFTVMGAQTAVTTFHYRAQSVVGAITMDDLCSNLSTSFGAGIKPLIPSVASYNGAELRLPFLVPQPAAVTSVAGAGVGTQAGGAMAGQVAGIIRRVTANAGPAYRGRIYVPFPYNAAASGQGIPVAAYETALGVLATNMETLGGKTIVAGAAQCTLHACVRHKDKAKPWTEIVDHRYPLGFATQRKRGFYGRPNLSPV